MLNEKRDVAVFGASPLAKLLAGLLAEQHGRRVLLVGGSNAAYRLARGFDLSVAPLTRPESWDFLAHAVPETLRLLGRIAGRGAFAHVDALFHAETPAGVEGLGHVRHMAAGVGRQVERLPEGVLPGRREGLVVHDAVLLNRARLETDLDTWLSGLDVLTVARREMRALSLERGGAAVSAPGVDVVADTALFADDDAIAALLPPETLGEAGWLAPATSILSEPTRPPHAPVLVGVDSGTVLVHRHQRGISAVAPGAAAQAVPAIGGLLAGHGHLRRAGQIGFRRVVSRDGGGLCGRPHAGAPVIVAGFGLAGAFLAPALARWLCETAEAAEAAYLAARGFARHADRPVAELAPLAEAAA